MVGGRVQYTSSSMSDRSSARPRATEPARRTTETASWVRYPSATRRPISTRRATGSESIEHLADRADAALQLVERRRQRRQPDAQTPGVAVVGDDVALPEGRDDLPHLRVVDGDV